MDDWKCDTCPECDEDAYSRWSEKGDEWTDVKEWDCDRCGHFETAHDSLRLEMAMEDREFPFPY